MAQRYNLGSLKSDSRSCDGPVLVRLCFCESRLFIRSVNSFLVAMFLSFLVDILKTLQIFGVAAMFPFSLIDIRRTLQIHSRAPLWDGGFSSSSLRRYPCLKELQNIRGSFGHKHVGTVLGVAPLTAEHLCVRGIKCYGLQVSPSCSFVSGLASNLHCARHPVR